MVMVDGMRRMSSPGCETVILIQEFSIRERKTKVPSFL